MTQRRGLLIESLTLLQRTVVRKSLCPPTQLGQGYSTQAHWTILADPLVPVLKSAGPSARTTIRLETPSLDNGTHFRLRFFNPFGEHWPAEKHLVVAWIHECSNSAVHELRRMQHGFCITALA